MEEQENRYRGAGVEVFIEEGIAGNQRKIHFQSDLFFRNYESFCWQDYDPESEDQMGKLQYERKLEF